MTFMIKRYLLISVFFTSCSSLDYSYFGDLKNYYSKNRIVVDQPFIDEKNYSFMKVSNSKNDAIFVLSTINHLGIYEWIGSNNESIKTKDGLIIETKGMRSDIKFYSYDISILEITSSFKSQINLYNPDLIFANITIRRDSSTSYINSEGSEIECFKIYKNCPRNWLESKRELYI